MDWVSTGMVMEEVGTIGYELACVFGVGAELVCDAIIHHGTDEQKEKYVKPLLRGDIFAAECLTEPRGGSDFFEPHPRQRTWGIISYERSERSSSVAKGRINSQ